MCGIARGVFFFLSLCWLALGLAGATGERGEGRGRGEGYNSLTLAKSFYLLRWTWNLLTCLFMVGKMGNFLIFDFSFWNWCRLEVKKGGGWVGWVDRQSGVE